MKWIIIGSGNYLSVVLHQAITWTFVDLLPIGSFGTNFSEFYQTFRSRKFTWPYRLQNVRHFAKNWMCVQRRCKQALFETITRDHFVHAPIQGETTLQSNVVSHWLD